MTHTHARTYLNGVNDGIDGVDITSSAWTTALAALVIAAVVPSKVMPAVDGS